MATQPYRQNLILSVIRRHPEGISSVAIWEELWGKGADESHGVSPNVVGPFVKLLADKGLVRRVEASFPGKKGRSFMIYPV